MDFSTGGLLTSLFIGLVGMGMIMYAKKAERVAPLVGGLALCIVPYFIHSLILTWIAAGACVAGTWALGKVT
ncbi:MAG: hypothetical protein JNK58_01155 [Phycisphaerae bacterium]|nr:hypothetical protein [Phycisphaerae bacterium]